jgi:hypothetical protein
MAMATALSIATGCTGTIEPSDGLRGGRTSNQPGQHGNQAGTDVPPTLQNATVGRGVVHRLTRTEYNNTVHDLLGVDVRPADRFPPDVGADGFDNASGSQSLSASHIEAFESGAEQLVDAWFASASLRSRVLTCNLTAGRSCIRQSLEMLLPKAWRRPVDAQEIDRLMGLADSEAQRGGTADDQLKLVLRGVFTSPHFLFRIERDQNPLSPDPHRLNGYELASRLSYFLWSTMPDDKLFGLAAGGTLQDDAVLSAQVERMLLDPRAKALIDVFANQWFQLPSVSKHETDAQLYPKVTPDLKLAMEEETRLFFEDVLHSGGSIHSLLAADYTFVNGALAAHYEISPPSGDGFARVSVTGTHRIGGVLGHASILTHTSGANETSPVKRGAWILTKILCSPPPPPPPNVVTELPEADPAAGIKTVRDRLAAHRKNPTCGGCHNSIDPVGLGLENYDPVGAYRDHEGTEPIDAAGELPGGAKFQNGAELARLLAEDPRLRACVAEKFFTFALGRAPVDEDTSHLDNLSSNNADAVRQVLTRLTLSEPFRSRRGESETEVKQ